jgi:hypothetical protein
LGRFVFPTEFSACEVSEDCSDLSTGLAAELILRRWIDMASFANPCAVWVKPMLDLGNDPLLAWCTAWVLIPVIPFCAKLQRIRETAETGAEVK